MDRGGNSLTAPYPLNSPKGLVWNEGLKEWACPTDVCGALCCQQDPWSTKDGGCRYLGADRLCDLQRGPRGPMYKPYWCRVWPRSDVDVERFNKLCADTYKEGHRMHGKRCQLYDFPKRTDSVESGIHDSPPSRGVMKATLLPWPKKERR